jgi:general secretion pathway protein B
MHNNCIATESLQPGMVIVQVTKQNGPLKIRKSGLVTSVEMIQGLIEMGIQEVQIDPNQTVEIETPVAQSSSTLQLLQSGSGIQHRQDNQLHDQFNRSLFLPSVQDIPSAWQFYARRYGLLSLTILCGLTIGFALAYLPSVLSLRSPLIVTESAPIASLNSEQVEPTLSQDALKLSAPTQPNSEIATPTVSKEQVAKVPSEPEKKPNSSEVQSKPSEKTYNKAESTDKDIVGANATPPAVEQLSPDLLKTFEKVIKEMDQEKSAGIPTHYTSEGLAQSDNPIRRTPALTPPSRTPSLQEVPRIDQLPAWVMNELPSMSFSAHMYASDPADRWVRVNGQRMLEGDVIDNKVKIVQIASQHVILNYQGHEFSMMAMTDW